MIGHDGVRVESDEALLLRALQRGQGAHCDARVRRQSGPTSARSRAWSTARKRLPGSCFKDFFWNPGGSESFRRQVRKMSWPNGCQWGRALVVSHYT